MDSSNNWFVDKTKEQIIKQINQLRKNIKKKHRSLKHEILENEELWEKQLKPIAEPLKKLVEESEQDQSKNNNIVLKRKLERNYEDEENPVIDSKRFIPNPPQGEKRKQKINWPYTNAADYDSDYEYDDGNLDLPPAKRPDVEQDTDMAAAAENTNNDDEMEVIQVQNPSLPSTSSSATTNTVVYETPVTGKELISTPQGRQLAKDYILKNFSGRLAKEYFLKLISENKSIDYNYGVSVQGDSWVIGDKPLEIQGNDLIINGKRYEGTRGLYELLFMNHPNEFAYDDIDLENYAEILYNTNVYRVNNSLTGKVKSNRGFKYRKIVSKLIHRPIAPTMRTYADEMVNPTSEGSGILLTKEKPSVIYFDDPNELVDRLRLLLASQEAGNTAHTNEINAILEELRELGLDLSGNTGE